MLVFYVSDVANIACIVCICLRFFSLIEYTVSICSFIVLVAYVFPWLHDFEGEIVTFVSTTIDTARKHTLYRRKQETRVTPPLM